MIRPIWFNRQPAGATVLVGALCFLTFALLRSRDYAAVDGGLRSLEVYHRGELFFHGNNHLLYPLNVFLWQGLLATLFGAVATPLEYLARTELMNALAAAGCAAVLYRLTLLVTESRLVALGAAALLASSRAFLLHATNAGEPMVGLFWSLLAILVLSLSLRDRRLWGVAVSGVLFVLSVATYQSMVLLIPAGLVLCLGSAAGSSPRGMTFKRLAALASGGLSATLVIFGAAYAAMGISGFAGKLRALFAIGGAPEIFGRPSLVKIGWLPVGFFNNLISILPEDFEGGRSLVASGRVPWIVVATGALAILGGLVTIRLKRRWSELDGRVRLWFAAGLTGLLVTAAGPAIWEPLYDKLWLQPIACMSFLAALTVTSLGRRNGRVGTSLTFIVAAALVGLNLTWMRPARAATPWIAQAERVAELVEPGDLVVEEWDSISVLYGSIWGGAPGHYLFDFPTTAVRRGAAVRLDLDAAVDAAHARGGRVLFIGILDAPRSHWDVFLGGKAQVPYASLDPYRAGARRIERLPFRDGTVSLFVWEGPSPSRPAVTRPPSRASA